MHERIEEIRRAEAASHRAAYTSCELYTPGSWLAKPVKTVLELLDRLEGREDFRCLDLGCGVGRNAIPVARAFPGCRVDCVDLLEMALEKLLENAAQHGVIDYVNCVMSTIDDYEIAPATYDLILAISALEHVADEAIFARKLEEIRAGLRPGGIACLIVNSGVREWNRETGEPLEPQFEVNLPTKTLEALLLATFAGCEVLKHTVVSQCYDIPREGCTAHLEADVVTAVVRQCK